MSSTDKTKLDGIAANANNYVLPKATATALGGVEVFDATVQTVAANAVTTAASRTYGVQLNAADQMVVNVPWTDANSGGTVTSVAGTGTVSGLTLSGTVTTSGSLTLGGTLSLTSGNVTTALGFTPANKAGDTFTGAITVNSGANQVILGSDGAIELTRGAGSPYIDFKDSTAEDFDVRLQASGTQLNISAAGGLTLNGAGVLTGITSGQVTTALGYTPYNATNPSGYTSNTGTVTSVSGTGTVSGLTLTGSVTTSGSLTLGGTLSLTSGNVTTALGYTPVQQNGGTGQLTNKLYIGWLGSNLGLQVDATNFGATWPIGVSGNAATATTAINLSTNRTNWSTNGTITAVVGQLAWKNYSNNHTIFDASNGTSPDGGAVNNTNAQVAWSGTYPTLMGWNGANTYGVRVDSARVADSAAAVTGTVAAANGGTGLTSPGASGNVLTSNGSAWVSSAPAGGSVSYPQNAQNGNYTLVLADAGKHIYSANTGAQTITIPTNASVAFPIGTLVTIVNEGTTDIVLSVTGVSVRNNGAIFNLGGPQIAPGMAVQLIKTGTNAWKATFGTISNIIPLQYLVIGGGGGGNSANGGGGGAGGYVTGSQTFTGGTIAVTVGAGGSVNVSGANSSLGAIATATGGGRGGGDGGGGVTGGAGGSGGGGGGYGPATGGSGTAGQGYNGGNSGEGYGCAGGGGAGEAGPNGGLYTATRGGNGLASSITGTSVTRAGGGGGGNIFGAPFAGGTGGGGAGGGSGSAAVSGTANTGSGGGGQAQTGTGGSGGSGVVIISSPFPGVATGSPTITTSGGNTIYQFNSSGTITF